MDFLIPLLFICGLIAVVVVISKMADSSSSGRKRRRGNRRINQQYDDSNLSILSAPSLHDTSLTPSVYTDTDINTSEDHYRPCEVSEADSNSYESGWESSSDAGGSGFDAGGGFDSGGFDGGCADSGGGGGE